MLRKTIRPPSPPIFGTFPQAPKRGRKQGKRPLPSPRFPHSTGVFRHLIADNRHKFFLFQNQYSPCACKQTGKHAENAAKSLRARQGKKFLNSFVEVFFHHITMPSFSVGRYKRCIVLLYAPGKKKRRRIMLKTFTVKVSA